MNFFNFFVLFPLKVELTDMWVKDDYSSKSALYFLIFLGAVIVGVIIINALKKGAPRSKGGSIKIASIFALQRLINQIGLNHEQAKMLKFVLRNDEAADPVKSLTSQTLLDQHFRRTYRLYGRSSGNDAENQHKLAVLFSTRNMLENTAVGVFTSTRQIKEETKLSINYNKEKLDVTVHSSGKNEFFTVDAPKNALGSQIKIAKGTKVNVLFFNKANKGFTFVTSVLGFSTSHGHQVMQLAHTNKISFLSKRRFRRRQTVIACFLFLIYTEGSGKKQRLIADKRGISGNIADISVGGCSVKITAPAKVGVMFKIEFTQRGDKITALGQVLRTNRIGINNVIHMKFLRLTQKSMNRINAFVYDYIQE
jgi:hypothetical protein